MAVADQYNGCDRIIVMFRKEEHGCGVVKNTCQKCGKSFETYFVHGDTHRPRLMQCNNCKSIYYYDEEYAYYIKPLNEQIKGKVCAECKSDLQKSLVKYKPSKKCNLCGGELKRGSVTQHDYREFYEIYSDKIKRTT